MTKTTNPHQRPSTRFSHDGRAVWVTLEVDRIDYEFARHWAEFHTAADPTGTAESQLEGYLSAAMSQARDQSDWRPPPDVDALYDPIRAYWRRKEEKTKDDDDIYF